MDYPRPHVPVQPVISLETLGRERRQSTPSVLDVGSTLHVTSGRMAIALALRRMTIGAGDQVLMPAYHCRAMVDAVVWSGATPVFYRIHDDTSVDLADVAAKATASTKVLVVVSYFGFPQDMAAIRLFCDKRRLMLLEDCAHAFFGRIGNRPVGFYGDFAVASYPKFFPVYEGGCLISSRHSLGGIALNDAGFAFQVKSALNALEKGFSYGRLTAVRRLVGIPMTIKDLIWRSVKGRTRALHARIGPMSADGGSGFEPEWMSMRASLVTRLIVRYAARSRIAERRRAIYRALQQALGSMAGSRPLFPCLPDGVVPYVFPLLVDSPEQVFPALKRAGVPVVRFAEFLWEGVDENICPVGADLSRRLMQFPCHQELSTREIKWMVDRITAVLLNREVNGNELETLSH